MSCSKKRHGLTGQQTIRKQERLFAYMAANHASDEEKLMFCDNLDAQTTNSFLDLLRQVGCSRFLTPPETTDLVQALDDGLGRLVKLQVSKQLEKWLDVDQNMHIWQNWTITASQKDI